MSRFMLMQSILGHMALLEEKYPKKANSPVCKKAKMAVKRSLKPIKISADGATRTYRKAA